MKPELEGGEGGEERRKLLNLVGSLRMEVSRIVTLFSSVLYLFTKFSPWRLLTKILVSNLTRKRDRKEP